jgi:hypothetical protein
VAEIIRRNVPKSEATLTEVRDFFEMTSSDFTKEWKQLDECDRQYFKEAVGAEIHKD